MCKVRAVMKGAERKLDESSTPTFSDIELLCRHNDLMDCERWTASELWDYMYRPGHQWPCVVLVPDVSLFASPCDGQSLSRCHQCFVPNDLPSHSDVLAPLSTVIDEPATAIPRWAPLPYPDRLFSHSIHTPTSPQSSNALAICLPDLSSALSSIDAAVTAPGMDS